MTRQWFSMLAGMALGLVLALATPAFAIGFDPAYTTPLLGPQRAKGVVVWSHGRSRDAEDSEAATPPYLTALRADRWDVLRFDRLREGDTLAASSRVLAEQVGRLKRHGYRRVVLAGQSFGGFLSLIAADESDGVDAVIATAPAAYGRFDDISGRWRMNAIRLYPLIAAVKRARVMLFFFHGDDFDPGGRGEHARTILAEHKLGFAVIDQPSYLIGHGAASSGAFLRRFGQCVRDFADNDGLAQEFACTPSWGSAPSAELSLPPELTSPLRPAAFAPAGSSEAGTEAANPLPGGVDTWYGFYPNGREVLLAIESHADGVLRAVYAIGPSIDGKYPAKWARRQGRIVDGEFVFDEPGKNILRFKPRPDHGLAATWIGQNDNGTLSAVLWRIDPAELARRD
jgi:pimeloyl-ACP methyl ester carboxylesterase